MNNTWDRLSQRVGRNDLPAILVRAVLLEEIITDRAEIVTAVSHAWSAAEWPEQTVTSDIWLLLFGLTGFHRNDTVEPAPTGPITLYRGAIPRYKRSMSWTDDLDRAIWFARRFDGMSNQTGSVYKTVNPPIKAILARYDIRGENEWVMDPRELRITKHGSAATAAA